MESDSTRIETIENRLARLERRLSSLEERADRAAIQGTWGHEASEPVARSAPVQPEPPAPVLPPVPVAAAAAGEPQLVHSESVVPWTVSPVAEPPAPVTPTGAEWGTGWTPPAARPPFSLRDLEDRFAGRALAWVGGIALVAAAVFFLSLAFSRGWVTEPMRVLIGLAVGAAGLVAGAVMLERRSALLGNVLAGVGLGIISIALLAATRLYDLVVPEVGLAGALAAAVAAAVIAIRYDARSVAAYGLIAALIAPPLVGATPNLLTLLFVAVILVGTTTVSLFRSWRWLPQIAFVLAGPQLASWILGDPDTVQAVIALAGFWLINVVAAAGEEVRIRRDDLRPSSATLVLANAAFLLWGILAVLRGPDAAYEGLAVALASVAHLAVGAWFLWRQGLGHLFGNLVAGSGAALLAIAAFIQLDAPAVPVAWAAEAGALAWLASRRLHRWSAAVSLVLGILAVAHLVMVEYPLADGGVPASVTFAPALLHPEAATLAALLLALTWAGVVAPVRWIRSVLVAVAAVLVAHALTFEATGTALAAALVLTALAALVIDLGLGRLPTSDRLAAAVPPLPLGRTASVAALAPGIAAIALLFATELPPGGLGVPAPSPFLNASFASLVVVLLGLLGAGALVAIHAIRSSLGAVGVLLLAWGFGFQVQGAALVGLLAVLFPLAMLLDRGLERLHPVPDVFEGNSLASVERLSSWAGWITWCLAALVVVADLAPVVAWGGVTPPAIPFSDEPALAAAFLAATALGALVVAPWVNGRRAALVAAVAAVAWVVPVEVFADGVVVLWIALAAVAFPATRRDPAAGPVWAGFAGLLAAGALAVALGIVAVPWRLAVADPSLGFVRPLLAGWPLAFAALVAGAWLAPRLPVVARWRRPLEAGAGALALYGVSVAVVDLFQRQVGGPTPVDELRIQAQVALSVCWTATGLVVLAAGFVRHAARLRHAGLLVLALATAKVFLVDLASMDVAYRALVLFGLGLLLLASAWIVTRSHGPTTGPSGLAGGAGTAA